MRESTLCIGAGAMTWVLTLLLAGCAGAGGTRHKMVAAPDADQVLGCQRCYDETIRVRRAFGKDFQWKRTQVISKHMCPDCKGDMQSYTEDGKLMIKCTSCASAGVACDRCLPPERGS